jgi:3-oxoacyl-[acyl-carrier protein] reductase
MNEKFTGKVALVTGGSRGIGRAIALKLSQDGFAVAVNYAGNAAKADEVVHEISAAGGRAIALQTDIAKPAEVERLFNETVKAFGGIDVVVNSAGVITMLPIGPYAASKAAEEVLTGTLANEFR